ncbi:UbiH/UbiF family hydroxylase (plasmid) [Pseudorhodobacter turbinis]|uniref:UbiH/UbiF family hydroxylase n=1 Tax=Pseudorhodobacter turbinis TaxID=2500533 RepID=A0A4V1E158_9RHOB|nr:UbiH/UbiF family hydroxylase [Pseudorhodobacter turbinis]QCO56984.1 UbiH/UbiF family hydroxylase [Pseudorhodobacter turbinis]
MTRQNIDILISGGGVAGLSAAIAFGKAGFSVLCVDPSAPVILREAAGADLRSTAFLMPSVDLFQEIGLWDRLSPYAAALQIMRIVDAGGEAGQARQSRDFDASDLSDNPFGYNLPNWLLRREMMAHIEDLPNVTFLPGIATTQLMTRQAEALVTLSDGSNWRARLMVGADGRNSATRQALGIPVKTTRYGQKALAFTTTHPIPHQNVSTEVHRSGGPFTMVPLPDHDGLPASAVVWMEQGAEVARLAALPVAEFEAEMSQRACHILGPMTRNSQLTIWPIISQIAARMSGQRTALMAEAAHVVPPIGAQGLNMSLADLASLRDLALAAPSDLGSERMLEQYHKSRHRDIQTRVTGINALNRASMVGAPILRDMRAQALGALYSVAPLRKTLMKAGLGLR